MAATTLHSDIVPMICLVSSPPAGRCRKPQAGRCNQNCGPLEARYIYADLEGGLSFLRFRIRIVY